MKFDEKLNEYIKELESGQMSDFIQSEAVNTFKNNEVFVKLGKWAIVSK